jgi:CHAT domain-containing protein/tetratricopeptide (TPR) repeat protein
MLTKRRNVAKIVVVSTRVLLLLILWQASYSIVFASSAGRESSASTDCISPLSDSVWSGISHLSSREQREPRCPEFQRSLRVAEVSADRKGRTASPKGADSPFVNFAAEDESEHLAAEMKRLCAAGNYSESLLLARKAVQLAGREYGSTHIEYAKALNNLGWHEQMTGNYRDARIHFDESLRLHEAKGGMNNPSLVPVLNNLGMLLCFQGDATAANLLLSRALAIEEKAFGKDCPDLIPALNNLALVRTAAGDDVESRKILERAAQLQELQATPDAAELAITIGNLANLEQRAGNLPLAESHFRKVLKILTEARSQPAEISECLNNIAMIEFALGKSNDALSHLKESLSLIEKGSKDQIDAVTTLSNLASVEFAAGNKESAAGYAFKAAEIVQHHIENVLPSLSFSEQKSFLATRLPVQVNSLNSVCIDPADASRVYSYLFRWKGLLIECLRWQSQSARVSAEPAYSKKIKSLQVVRNDLSRLFHQSGEMELPQWQKEMQEKTRQKEQLERSIAAETGGALSDVLTGTSLMDFCKLLRPSEQLVDLYSYRNSQGKRSYSAYVAEPDGKVTVARLADAGSSSAVIEEWRTKVVSGEFASEDWQQISRAIGGLIGSCLNKQQSRVFICPDGDLCKVPLNLLDEMQGMLVAELDSPRELAYLRGSANPTAVPPASADGTTEKPDLLCIGDLDFGSNTEGIVFPHLPGTRKEIASITATALRAGWRTRVLTGSSADGKSVTASIPQATAVHFATHGFFSRGGFSMQLQELKLTSERLEPSATAQLSRTPLAESGLVLSCPPGSRTPDLLTAEEIIGLPAGKCRSVVLSACETGLGSTENGQGVLGLRASFIAAGMHRLIMSLWKVPDESSSYLMEKFYEGLLVNKESPAVALKNAQVSVRNAKYGAFQKPAHWMGWVLVGEGW